MKTALPTPSLMMPLSVFKTRVTARMKPLVPLHVPSTCGWGGGGEGGGYIQIYGGRMMDDGVGMCLCSCYGRNRVLVVVEGYGPPVAVVGQFLPSTLAQRNEAVSLVQYRQ